MKRSRLSERVTSDIMFVRENIDLLREYCHVNNETKDLLLPMVYEDDTDIGQGGVKMKYMTKS